MIPKLILFVSLGFFWWLLKRDIAARPGLSRAIWIPTIWVAIISSRPLSTWIGFGGAEDTLEGSPMDRLFYFGMIAAALFTLSRRNLDWQGLIARNWPILLFYGFLLVSVSWANSPLTSFKRWFKEFGNLFVLLIILTEPNPMQAFRAVFVRCAYVLIPLSVIFIRYFPEIGRRYNIHSGVMEAVGVTMQKNSLGAMVLVTTLMLLWDWLERSRSGLGRNRFLRALPLILIGIGIYLLQLCDSKTSLVCLVLGAVILVAGRSPLLKQRLAWLVPIALGCGLGLLLLDQAFDLKEGFLKGLGRDATFTGRTDVWRELRNAGTDPLLGTGYMSFWDDKQYRAKLPNWVAYSAHNGYLEVYLAGGYVGVAFLALMLLVIGRRIHRALRQGGEYAVVRFAVYVAMLIASISESNFACMSPVGFLFLLVSVEMGPLHAMASESVSEMSHSRSAGEQVPVSVIVE